MKEKVMIEVGGHLVSEELIKENFICNLEKCKGACCVEGDSGAPLNEDELSKLEEVYQKVKPYMTAKGIEAVEQNGTYVKDFEGDYTTLSNWLGTDLDFYKVQNMLIGQAMDDLRKGKYANTIENKLYKLKDINDKQNVKSFYFEASNFLIKRQEIEQVAKNRKLNVYYPNHKEYAEAILPLNILIEASHENEKNTISLDYNSVTFNEELSFPYSVPSDYEQIFIEN